MQLTGELSKINLPNLLRLAKNGGLTGKIALLQGTKAASIFLENGNVVHVETDEAIGKDGLMELFLWACGSFSFIEESVKDIQPTFNPASSEDSTDNLLRDGIVYLEQKNYLDQLRITGKSVLEPTELAFKLSEQCLPQPVLSSLPILTRLNGQSPLQEVLQDFNLSKRASVHAIATLLKQGLAVLIDAPGPEFANDQVNLPDWVVARLKQDNADISQAIVDMVIWVDRVKCWMYQADADFSKLIAELTVVENSEGSEEDVLKRTSHDTNELGSAFNDLEAVRKKS